MVALVVVVADELSDAGLEIARQVVVLTLPPTFIQSRVRSGSWIRPHGRWKRRELARIEDECELGRCAPSEFLVGPMIFVVCAPTCERNARLANAVNSVSFNNSSRCRPLRPSMKRFCMGLPDAM